MKQFLRTHWLCTFIVIGLVILLVGQKITEPTNDYQELIHSLDSLNSKLDSLQIEKDSLVQVIDSSKASVEYINKWYEKTLIDITNQSIASDVVFFTEYISKTDTGFVNSNNSTATKGN